MKNFVRKEFVRKEDKMTIIYCFEAFRNNALLNSCSEEFYDVSSLKNMYMTD